MPVLIQHALLASNGMEMAVCQFPVHQTHSIMVPYVFQLMRRNANHGNISMEFNVFISLKNVLLGHIGTKQLVFHRIGAVLLAIMDQAITIYPFHKNVHPQPYGYQRRKYASLKEMVVLKEHICLALVVNLIFLVQMDKNGIQLGFSALAPKKHNGVDKSVFLAMVAECGCLASGANAL